MFLPFSRFDENREYHHLYRSPDNSTDISFAHSPIKYRSNTQLNDRSSPSHRHQPKVIRTHSRTYSSSSTEQTQPSIFSPRSSNETSDNDDEQNNLLLRRKYLKSQQTSREQQLPPSPPLKYASNGVLLRPKQQNPINSLQISSNDTSQQLKRFSLDQQQTSEPMIYRSTMAIAPNQTNNNQKPIRDESNHEFQQQRSKVRGIIQRIFERKFRFFDRHVK